MDRRYYIYFHINPIKNEVFYVGKGTRNRAYSKCSRNIYWNNIVNKYGYIINIIEDKLTHQEAIDREIFYIKKIGRVDLGLGSLVNMTDGGDGGINNKNALGKKRSQESRDKISLSRKGMSPWNKGKKGLQTSTRKGIYKEYGDIKICSKCELSKSIYEFYPYDKQNNRVRSICKKCDNSNRIKNKNNK